MIESALTQIPAPDAQAVAQALITFIAGMTVPTRYGIERMEGFGRAVASKLPYMAPPGMDAETAMQQAVEKQADSDTDNGGT
ncbi:hypothetical protein [Haloarcula marismortui]|jgi:hypothetical protein|uniref:Uncharacterized protein n=2 Tax=Haloarcula marismortui ATCC 33800 TaxID=662476 RepID=A0A8T8KEA2_9EURY|nr:hypothetical protein [Haloarcula sinaiiensis]QUJ71262.1 hypothetical protein KDQ40_11110 [Haloarcula sinaiiensis ATCC 33800]